MNRFIEYTSKEHLFNLIDLTDDKLSFVDRNYIYRAVNKAYMKGFNRPMNAIIGRHIQEIIGIEVFENVVKPYLERAFTGEETYYEAWFDFPDTTRSYLIVRYKPIYGVDDEVVGVAVTATDITERKRSEEKKRIEDKLLIRQSRMADIGEMVAFIAHQWRRPLHTLSTYLLKMHQKLEENSCREFDKELIRSEEILEHLSQSLESLYHFHNDEGGAVSVKTSVKEVGHLLEPHLNAANITLNIDITDTMSINTDLPTNRLLHLFLVFIENAIEALEKSDRKDKKITVSGHEEDELIIINIQDNGEGITGERSRHIFEAGVSTKESDSHGYGLYFAQKILTEQLGGSVILIPTEAGAWFQLTFTQQLK